MLIQQMIERIDSLAKDFGTTRNKLLIECGVKSYVDNLNKGRLPNTETAMKIADYCGVSVDYLLCRTDDPQKVVPLSEDRGGKVLQCALRDTGLLNQDGTISKDDAEIIAEFLVSNAKILKKLMNKEKE